MKSNNPWINMLMKSMNIGSSINEHITDEAIDNMIDSMLEKRVKLIWQINYVIKKGSTYLVLPF